MVKNLIRGLVVVAVLVSSFLLCEKVLMLKSEDGIEQMKSFYLQKENTVDVLLVGSSHIYCNVNTGELWDTYGMSAFDLGGAEQPYWNSYYYIKEALKTQRPKVIVMNVTIPGIRFDDYQSEVWLNTNLYGMHWNKNRIENTDVSALPQSFWRILFPMNTMHGRYSDLSKDDFVDKNYDISYKGFDYRATITPFETPDISNVTECEPIIPKQEEYLRKIIQLTKDENIPLLLVSVPFVVTEDAQKYYNYEFKIAEEEGVDYIDFNKLYSEMGLDFSVDMAEDLHLNITGSQKFTRYLGYYIKEKYGTEDHRGDLLYASWDKDALIHRQEINSEYLLRSDSLKDYLASVSTENYLVFLNARGVGDADLSEIAEPVNILGVNSESLRADSSYIMCGQKSLFASADSEFSTYCDEESSRLVFDKSITEDDSKTRVNYNTEDYDLSGEGISILIYDRVLDKIVGHVVYDTNNGNITRLL